MRSWLMKLAVLSGVTACGLLTPGTFAQEGKPVMLGKVRVDEHQAEVAFEDWSPHMEVYRVALSIRKPRQAAAIDGRRLDVWLLTLPWDSSSPAIPVYSHPRGPLPEEGDGDTVTAKAVFSFPYHNFGGYAGRAVVVAVDGEPTSFQVGRERDHGGITPRVVTAWQNAGTEFSWYWLREDGDRYGPRPGEGALPTFRLLSDFPLLSSAPQPELPLPAVPFGLFCYNKGKGFLARVPGRAQARGMWLYLDTPPSADDWMELAGLKQLEIVSFEGGGKVGEAALRAVAGLERLERLSAADTGVRDAHLKHLAGLKRLRTLGLGSNEVTGQGLKQLAPLQALHTLDLSRTSVGDDDLRELAALPNLRKLDLSHTRVTGAGLKGLAGLQQLEALSLRGTGVTDAGLGELAALPRLRSLDLEQTKVTGVGLKELATLPLEDLSLAESHLSDAGARELAHLKRLRALNLSRTAVGGAGLAGLAGLGDLRQLQLDQTKATNAGCKHLAGLSRLRVLSLFATKVGDAGVKELAGLKELRVLRLGDTGVTEKGLKALTGLKQLAFLDIRENPRVSAGAREALTAALPWTYIPW